MFERLNTPQEALNYKLGATLKMEQKVLEVLDDNIEHARDGALEVEHHELGVYENLLINIKAMGRDDVARLLHQNFESEQDALDKVRALQAEVAAVTPKQPA